MADNDPFRRSYRALTDAEVAQLAALKAKAGELLALIEELRTPPEPVEDGGFEICAIDRELNIATERLEEAVMWAAKHVTRG